MSAFLKLGDSHSPYTAHLYYNNTAFPPFGRPTAHLKFKRRGAIFFCIQAHHVSWCAHPLGSKISVCLAGDQHHTGVFQIDLLFWTLINSGCRLCFETVPQFNQSYNSTGGQQEGSKAMT